MEETEETEEKEETEEGLLLLLLLLTDEELDEEDSVKALREDAVERVDGVEEFEPDPEPDRDESLKRDILGRASGNERRDFSFFCATAAGDEEPYGDCTRWGSSSLTFPPSSSSSDPALDDDASLFREEDSGPSFWIFTFFFVCRNSSSPSSPSSSSIESSPRWSLYASHRSCTWFRDRHFLLSKRAERTSKQKRQCAIVAITLGWRGECWLDGCCGFDCGGLVRAGGGTLRCYDALIPHHTPYLRRQL
jgi:hypothetical protein